MYKTQMSFQDGEAPHSAYGGSSTARGGGRSLENSLLGGVVTLLFVFLFEVVSSSLALAFENHNNGTPSPTSIILSLKPSVRLSHDQITLEDIATFPMEVQLQEVQPKEVKKHPALWAPLFQRGMKYRSLPSIPVGFVSSYTPTLRLTPQAIFLEVRKEYPSLSLIFQGASSCQVTRFPSKEIQPKKESTPKQFEEVQPQVVLPIPTQTGGATSVWIAQKTILKNQPLTPSLFRLEKRPLSTQISAHQNDVTHIATLQGKVARRLILKGTVLQISMLKKPDVVDRGDPVLISDTQGGISITTMGIALTPGIQGDTIRVQHYKSRKILLTRVIGRDHVEVLKKVNAPSYY